MILNSNIPQDGLSECLVDDTDSGSSSWGPSGNATGSKASDGGGPSSGIVAKPDPAFACWRVSYLGLYGSSSSPYPKFKIVHIEYEFLYIPINFC